LKRLLDVLRCFCAYSTKISGNISENLNEWQLPCIRGKRRKVSTGANLAHPRYGRMPDRASAPGGPATDRSPFRTNAPVEGRRNGVWAGLLATVRLPP
jgi:hypothetical protein